MISIINEKFEQVSHKSLPEIKLCFMDPPDNIGVAYNGYDDNLPENDYKNLLEQWILKACNITDGPVFLSISDKWISHVEYIIEKWGNATKLIQRIYWHWTFGQNQKNKYTPSVRHIYWMNSPVIYPNSIKIPSQRATIYKDKRAAGGGKTPDNLWKFNRVCGTFKEKRKWHCNQHPEALVKRIVVGHTKPGDVVLDPFVGSGTSAYVCYDNNRDFIGYDASPFYVQKIKEEFHKRYDLII